MLFTNKTARQLYKWLFAPLCIAVLATGVFFFRSEDKTAEAAWYNSGWQYRVKLTIDANKVAPTTVVETFTTSGTWSKPEGVNTVEALVIGGGGGGGYHRGGGGGAGGYATGTVDVSGTTSVHVVVGTGGSAGTSGTHAGNGGGSSFATLSVNGGGGGGSSVVGQSGGNTGGSGGGGSGGTTITGNGQGALGTTGEGNDGGNGGGGTNGGGGGGGGAGGNGYGGANPGHGGPGLASSITGSSVTRAGGGGGSRGANGTGLGGSGGGGDGSSGVGIAGTANTGGGGGGGYSSSNGGAGGSGVVIIRYEAGVSDFPVYVDLSDLPEHVWDNMRSDCGDIRVTTSNGSTEVPREIVSCDNASSTGEMHFKAPSLSASSDTVFYVYYGNAGQGDYAVDATYGAENVWTNGYAGVYHLNEDPGIAGAGGILDSTSNNRDGTDEGSMDGTDNVAGKLGTALDFDGVDDNVLISGLMGSPANVTVSAWVDLDSRDTTGAEVVSLGDHFYLRADHSSRQTEGNYYYAASSWRLTDTPTNIAGTSWRYLSFVMDDTNNAQRVHIDGATAGTATYSESILWAGLGANTYIGENGNGGTEHNLNGRVDEVRVSNVARDTSWIETEYNNQHSPETFYTIGNGPSTVTFFLTSGTSWTVPDNWNSASNTIEVIGGGGGGAYSKISNLALTSGASVFYGIGSAGAAGSAGAGGGGGDTYFNGTGTTCAAQSVCAKGGIGGGYGNNTQGAGGNGGATGSGIGTVKYNGGGGKSGVAATYGGGGGGAAGPGGDGTTASTADGGSGGNGQGGNGGSGGNPPSSGGNGQEWDATHGSGGGGGGVNANAAVTGASGGSYGGGGGGARSSSVIAGGSGAQGIIVITYTPAVASNPETPSFLVAPTNASSTAITMTATTTDTGDNIETQVGDYFEYYFALDNTSCGADAGTGGTDSGWIATSTYTDTGLQPNKCYGYTVTARDGLGNSSATSTASSTYTSAATPGAPIIENQLIFSETLDIFNSENGNPVSNPATLFVLQISSTTPLDSNWNGKYLDASGNPTSTPVWLSDTVWDSIYMQSVLEGTTYQMRSKARNQDGDETPFGPVGTSSTPVARSVNVEIRGGTRLQGGVRLQ